mgnify:CR=1 FL=1
MIKRAIVLASALALSSASTETTAQRLPENVCGHPISELRKSIANITDGIIYNTRNMWGVPVMCAVELTSEKNKEWFMKWVWECKVANGVIIPQAKISTDTLPTSIEKISWVLANWSTSVKAVCKIVV